MRARVTVSLKLAPFPSITIISRDIGAVTRIVSPCLVYWHCRNPNLKSRGTVAFCSGIVPHKASDSFEKPIVCWPFLH